MKKIFCERNIVVILFVAAFTVFSFAQEDAKKIEKRQGGGMGSNSSIISSPKQTAAVVPPSKQLTTPEVIR